VDRRLQLADEGCKTAPGLGQYVFRPGIGQSEEVEEGGGATLTFTVMDIDAARAYLEGEGVRFDGETHQVEDMVKLCTFYDPDGNALMLAQQLR
jgi:catechol 2,3-dioxygenase-like lactoylglutathione lyase family enzyme